MDHQKSGQLGTAGQSLRIRRMERGLTITQVAHAAGIPVRWVVAVERGERMEGWITARIKEVLLRHPCLPQTYN